MSFRPKPAIAAQDLRSQNEFVGHFRRVTFENEDGSFKIVTFKLEDGKEFKAAGNFYGAAPGELMRIKGQWREHQTYGWTFQAESYIHITPTTEEGILAYLGSGLIKGVKTQTAKKIVDHFGEKTLEVLDHAPELLREVKGVSAKTLRAIVDQWNGQKASREAMIFLKGVGLTNALALRLLRHYGDTAAAILRTNPYRVGMEVKGIGFVKADEIAAKMGVAKDSPLRIQGALVHLLDAASGEGHTYLPKEMLIERSAEMLSVDRSMVEAQLAEAVAKEYIRCVPLEDGHECYFMPSLYQMESGLTKLLLGVARQARPLVEGSVDERIAEFEQRYRFNLAPQQQDALRSVVTGGVCVITGGPGTGKTTLVRALLYIMKGNKVRFALCSPTGRAAQRLSETTGEEAATVHRLLKWNAQSGRFMHNAENKLPLDLLIVDEASMLDVQLAYSLLRAIPARASIVFVGDVDQLPSVGPGTFLKDLIGSGRARVTRLETIFRQARESLIIQNSHRINQGLGLVTPEADNKEADFYFIDRDDPEKIREAMLAMATDRIPKRLGIDPIDGVQVLTPMRRGPLGTVEINDLLQARLNPQGRKFYDAYNFRIGDKVMQSVNNYDLDVYNGDVGKVMGMDPETQQVKVLFGKRVVYYSHEELDELELAYSVTIHKSQGSEYPAVIVLLHTTHFVMLKRNLLYTAVTRGKKLVVVIGSRKALFKAIRTSSEAERLTALEYWLKHPPEKTEIFDH